MIRDVILGLAEYVEEQGDSCTTDGLMEKVLAVSNVGNIEVHQMPGAYQVSFANGYGYIYRGRGISIADATKKLIENMKERHA